MQELALQRFQLPVCGLSVPHIRGWAIRASAPSSEADFLGAKSPTTDELEVQKSVLWCQHATLRKNMQFLYVEIYVSLTNQLPNSLLRCCLGCFQWVSVVLL